MITHSDNTATDATIAQVGAERVRALIAAAGLDDTLIPESTRMLFSWLAGARRGKDVGWKGMKQIDRGHLFGKPRSPINDHQTMQSTASDLVSYYRRALRGDLFAQTATLTEFKRIQAMAGFLSRVVPPDVAAYGKGGSINWLDFHAVC